MRAIVTVDHNRAVDLYDMGGGDYRAVVVVGPGGPESYALRNTKDWDQTTPIPIPEFPRTGGWHRLRRSTGGEWTQ